MKIKTLFVLCAFLTPLTLYAGDWSSCQMGFSNMSIEMSSASMTAMNLDSINQDIERLKRKLINCQTFPDVYDLMKDGCTFDRRKYNSEIDRYNGEINNLNMQVHHLTMEFKSMLLSCGFK